VENSGQIICTADKYMWTTASNR